MTNVLIKVDGDKASGDAYFIVSQHAAESGAVNAPHTSLVRGRHLDSWTKRGDRRAIAHRETIVDLSTDDHSAMPNRSAGRRDNADPSYAFNF